LTGLPGPAGKTTADRVRAAIINGGFTWPDGPLAVNLRPAAEGGNAGCDLGVAVAVLAATGAVPYPSPPEDMMFFAELGLDGRLRPVPSGTAEAAACAAAAGMRAVVVAEEDAAVPAMGPVRAVAAGSLAEVPDLIRNLREDQRTS
jgi:magnesium chelatase family protein